MLGGTNTTLGRGKGGDEITVPITYKNNDLNIGDTVILTKKVEVEQPLCNPTNYYFSYGGPFCNNDDGYIYGNMASSESSQTSIQIYHTNNQDPSKLDFIKSVSTQINYYYSMHIKSDRSSFNYSKALDIFAMHDSSSISNNNMNCLLLMPNPYITLYVRNIEGYQLSKNSDKLFYDKKESDGTYSLHCLKLSVDKSNLQILSQEITMDEATNISLIGLNRPTVSPSGNMVYFANHIWKYNEALNKYEHKTSNCGVNIDEVIGMFASDTVLLNNDGWDMASYVLDEVSYQFTQSSKINMGGPRADEYISYNGIDNNNNFIISRKSLSPSSENYIYMFHLNDDNTLSSVSFDVYPQKIMTYSYANIGNTYFIGEYVYKYSNLNMIFDNVKAEYNPNEEQIKAYSPLDIVYTNHKTYKLSNNKLYKISDQGNNLDFEHTLGKKNTLLNNGKYVMNEISQHQWATWDIADISGDYMYDDGIFAIKSGTISSSNGYASLYYQEDSLINMTELEGEIQYNAKNNFIVGKNGFCILFQYGDKVYDVTIDTTLKTYTATPSARVFKGHSDYFSYGSNVLRITDDNRYLFWKGRSGYATDLIICEITPTEIRPISIPSILNNLIDSDVRIKCFENHYIQVFSKRTLTLLRYNNDISDIQIVHQFRNIENGTFSVDLSKAIIEKNYSNRGYQNFGGQFFNYSFTDEYNVEKYNGVNFNSNSITGIVKDKTEAEIIISTVLPELISGSIIVNQDDATINLIGSEA